MIETDLTVHAFEFTEEALLTSRAPTEAASKSGSIGRTIAIALPCPAGGGAERVMLDLAVEFQRAGHRVLFFVGIDEGEFREEVKSQFEMISLGTTQGRKMLLPLVRAIQKHRPDAILAGLWPLTAISIVAAKLSRTNCRVVVSDHNLLSIQYRDWGLLHRVFLRLSIAMTYRLADGCVGVSKGVVDDISRLGNLPNCQMTMIHNPIRSPVLIQPGSPKLIGLVWDDRFGKRILAVGSFKKVKNFSMLIEAFALLCDRVNAQLTILGDGTLRKELEQTARECGVHKRVHMPGFQTDLAPYYQTADLFVLSSDNEGFGNVLVEALACGVPIVATDCPTGPREILENGQFGKLVPVGDAVTLSSAMERELDNHSDCESLIRRAAEFKPEVAATKYLNLLFNSAVSSTIATSVDIAK
ncbi:glycosyltransferase [Rhodopirellula baltica]|uniref:Glycosyltransferase n=1 Tax=Rhodopirellula baltica WH47 TaxID=991778 RepID=F2ALR4_RHOBT|nr:glycosyltransferase [Rhodopirellula baltica]EGF29410.1 glycosyltransferase [Rhodopirellula baltica WH47]